MPTSTFDVPAGPVGQPATWSAWRTCMVGGQTGPPGWDQATQSNPELSLSANLFFKKLGMQKGEATEP